MNAGTFVFQSGRKALELLEDRVDARLGEESDGVLGVLVEVGVEDALVHEVRVAADVEEHPPEVVELERREHVRIALDSLLRASCRSARISSSVPGLVFAMIVKPWHAGVRGKTGP